MIRKKHLAFAAALLVVVGLVLMWRSGRGGRKVASAPPPAGELLQSVPPEPPPLSPELLAIAAEQQRDVAAVERALTPEVMESFTRRAQAAYLESSKYPPTSRPAASAAAVQHLVEWNRGQQKTQRMNDDPRDQSGLFSRIALDRSLADRGQAITISVAVWRGDENGPANQPAAGVDVTIGAEVQVLDAGATEPNGWRSVAKVGFTREGAGWLGRFTPSEIAGVTAEDVVQRRALVTLRAADGPGIQQMAPLDFAYVGEPPLVVLGKRRESVDRGSLRVGLDVNVRVTGFFVIRALLYDQDGTTPLAVFEDKYQLTQVGPYEIPLTFFGKILADRGVSGRYQIRALHGAVFEHGKQTALTWHHDQPIVTASYQPREFSKDEWQSPEKTARLEHYRKAMTAFK